ncbi:hypothetical protein P8452_32787 [Trifolium repens]|nr:hypothetical protein P8452_32787 [Trifolium repens]
MMSLIRIEALVPLPPTENTKRHGRFNRHAFFNPTTKSILKDEWKEIGKDVKDKIWEDLESYFVIPVIDPDPDKDPLRKMYGKSFWHPELPRNLRQEVKLRSLQDSTLSDERSPSPPPREEKWKRARQGKDGEYKSAATKVVADKIDSLVEETAKGTFVPNGHNDILTNAIGTAEHGGRVRGAERVLQLWCTYMHRLSIATNNSDLYAFLDPCQLNFAAKPNSIQKAGKQYIQNKLRDVKKECYLAPYLVPKHWKLIIMCPKDNIIVCLCSLHQKVDEATKKYFTDAFMVHQFACGNRKKPTWIFPKTRVQPNGNDCGYYVMKNMIDIVSASVTKKWDEVFNDPTALSEDDLYELRNRWATCFLDLYNPEKDYDDGDDDGAKGR